MSQLIPYNIRIMKATPLLKIIEELLQYFRRLPLLRTAKTDDNSWCPGRPPRAAVAGRRLYPDPRVPGALPQPCSQSPNSSLLPSAPRPLSTTSAPRALLYPLILPLTSPLCPAPAVTCEAEQRQTEPPLKCFWKGAFVLKEKEDESQHASD